jgi:glycosyltransferase involved in cell wall biosynthesis
VVTRLRCSGQYVNTEVRLDCHRSESKVCPGPASSKNLFNDGLNERLVAHRVNGRVSEFESRVCRITFSVRSFIFRTPATVKNKQTKHKGVVLLGPSLAAVSGVSTHLNQLFDSDLRANFELYHFQVGGEARDETLFRTIVRLAASPLGLARLIMRTRAEIVHINSSLEPKAYWRDLAYLAVARFMRRKVVLQVHGGASPTDFLRGRLGLMWLRRTLSVAHAVVVLAQVERENYESFVPAERLVLIPNAIQIPAPGEVRTIRGGASNATLRLAFVGRLARDKGIFEVLEAVRILDRTRYPVHLTVAGSGECDSELRELTVRCGLERCVSFRGVVFGNDKTLLWASADLFVFPTYHREGLPYALLEAMAAGAVPVVSPVGAIADVVTDGEHGVFVPPRDPSALAEKIAYLFANRHAIAAMSVAARRRIQEAYSVPRLARDFARLYGKL